MSQPEKPSPDFRRDKIWAWCLPALILGGLLRFWLLQGWEVGLYYGPDSQSYWHPVYMAKKGGPMEFSRKRPWLYPVLARATLVSSTPPARTAVVVQHVIGWLLVLPLADMLARLTLRWRWWVVPATVVYTCHPQLLFWEHVLIADSLFIALSLLSCWAFLRFWLAPGRWIWLAAALSLTFFSMAARPVGRAFWLGISGLLLVLPNSSWRKRMACSGASLLLYVPAGEATQVKQGESLLFTSVFPLLVLDRPPHLDVKAELAPAVQSDRANLWRYVTDTQRDRWSWLEADRSAANVGPAYHRVVKDKPVRARFVSELTRQALLAHPFKYLGMTAMKLYWLCGLNEKSSRFEPERFRPCQVKFLSHSIEKYGPDFPAWLLRAPGATTPEGIQEATERAVARTELHSIFLRWIHRLERYIRLYRLPSTADTPPWPSAALPLSLFLLASGATLLRRNAFAPMLALGLGYLVLTLIVGRAVERYRLPAEFIFVCGVFLGLETLVQMTVWVATRIRGAGPRPVPVDLPGTTP